MLSLGTLPQKQSLQYTTPQNRLLLQETHKSHDSFDQLDQFSRLRPSYKFRAANKLTNVCRQAPLLPAHGL